MTFKSILKPEGSTMAGIATVAGVLAVYQLNLSDSSRAHATEANHPVLEASRKKAGLTALAFVAGLTLITRDANVGILGGGSIIAMELVYRHSIMVHPGSGVMQNPNPNAAYEPAQNVVPMFAQGETA